MTSAFRPVALFLLAAAALVPAAVIADQVLSDSGLEITIKELKKEIPDFGAFSLEVKNTTPEPRTFSGKIVLSNDTGEVGSCTLYVAVPGKQTSTKTVQCKGIGFTAWKAAIVKVYPFIVDD